MATSATVCRSNFISHPLPPVRQASVRRERQSREAPLRSRLVGSEADFDRYIAEHNIPEEEWPEAFARWIAERTGGPEPRFEKVEPGGEQILPDREQRELDALPSPLALRGDETPAASPKRPSG
jgi:hypothetical protein